MRGLFVIIHCLHGEITKFECPHIGCDKILPVQEDNDRFEVECSKCGGFAEVTIRSREAWKKKAKKEKRVKDGD